MPDPITHSTSPWVVSTLAAAASFLFDLPLGVVITAAGGAYWAVYRDSSLEVSRSIFLILAGMFIASVMVSGVEWFFDFVLNIKNIPQRPIAFMLGFATIDKQFRDAIFEFFKEKLSFLQVKK